MQQRISDSLTKQDNTVTVTVHRIINYLWLISQVNASYLGSSGVVSDKAQTSHIITKV